MNGLIHKCILTLIDSELPPICRAVRMLHGFCYTESGKFQHQAGIAGMQRMG